MHSIRFEFSNLLLSNFSIQIIRLLSRNDMELTANTAFHQSEV